ncbi:MAG: hypothetical protein ACFHX7_07805 [Pseudomonadota bacterium]
MDGDIVKGGIVGVLGVLLVLAYLNTFGFASRGAEPKSDNGCFLLEYAPSLKFFAIAWAFISAYCAFGIFTSTFQTAEDSTFFFVVALVFLYSAYATVREIYTVSIKFDENEFVKVSPFAKFTAPLNWRDVEKVTYSGNYHAFELHSKGRTVRVSRYMAGLCAFLKTMNEKVPPQNLQEVRADLDVLLSE